MPGQQTLREYSIRQKGAGAVKNPPERFEVDGEFIHISSFDTSGFADPANAKIKIIATGGVNGETIIEARLKEKQSIRLSPGNQYSLLSLQATEEVPLVCDITAGFGFFTDTADPASVDVSENVRVIESIPVVVYGDDTDLLPPVIVEVPSGVNIRGAVQATTPENQPLFVRSPAFYPMGTIDNSKVKRSEQYGLGAVGNFHKPTAFSLFTRPWVERPKRPGTVNISAPAMALKLQRPAIAQNINNANFRRLVITKMSVAWEVGIAIQSQIGIPARQEDFAIYKTTSTPDRIIAGTINTSLPGIQSGFRSVGNPIPDSGFSTGPTTAGIYTDDPAVEVVLSNDAEPTPHPGNKIYISTRFFEAEAAAVTPISPNGDTAFTIIQKLGNSQYTLWNESGGQYSIHKAIWEPKIPIVLFPGEGIFFGPNEIMPVTNANFYSRGRFFEIHGYVVTDALQSF